MSTDRHQASTKIIEGLVQVAFVALQDNFPNVRVDLDEIELLVDALDILDPRSAKPAFARGTLQIVRKDWQEAIHIFRKLSTQSKCLPHSQAMLTYALNRVGDPEWRFEAEPLRASADAGVSLLARSLIAQDNPASNREPAVSDGASNAEPALGQQPSASKEEAAAPRDARNPAWASFALRA
jgi:type III secretion system HrpB1/HrpK family protein